MSKVNIQGINDIDDPFYRYQMDKIKFIDQKHKTVIDNFDKVCHDIKRDPKILIDFYKKRLGVSIIHKDGKIFLPSNIDKNKINQFLREFIETYVLCDRCKLPETRLDKDKDDIYLSCDSCGFTINKKVK